MPKIRNITKSEKTKVVVGGLVVKSMPKDTMPDKLEVGPETIRQWMNDIIPDGSGVPAKTNYDKMDRFSLEKEYDRLQAVAKMYLIERIIQQAPHEKDIAKISGALRDIANIAVKAREEEPGARASAWGELVDKAIRDVIKKRPIINVIQNQQINNGSPED